MMYTMHCTVLVVKGLQVFVLPLYSAELTADQNPLRPNNAALLQDISSDFGTCKTAMKIIRPVRSPGAGPLPRFPKSELSEPPGHRVNHVMANYFAAIFVYSKTLRGLEKGAWQNGTFRRWRGGAENCEVSACIRLATARAA
jgi:hypothetical protein